MLPAFGFDYVPGDLAARLAAEQVEGPLDEIVVAYATSGVGTSRGTRGTISRVMAQEQVAWEDGRLVPSRFGATTRTVRFPFGERTVVEWSGTEPLTVPRHTEVRNVRSYVRAPGARGAVRRAGPARRAVRAGDGAHRAGGPVRGRAAEEPLHGRRRGDGAGRRAAAPCSPARDVYGLTALLLVRGAQALAGRRGARHRRARAGGGVRRAHARLPPRAAPRDRRLMSSGPPLTVRPCNGSDR